MLRPLSWAGALAVAVCLSGSLYAQSPCPIGSASATLDVNNVEARLYNTGTLFWQGEGNHYVVPRLGKVSALFNSVLWIGGYVDDELRMAASRYGPDEFVPGPVNGGPADCDERDRMYSVYQRDVEAFDAGQPASLDLLAWPWQLGAPVVDGDGNPNNYNLNAGDRPEILGHQTIWWVMNDLSGEHPWSQTPAIGMEVQVTAFAAASDIDAINDATLYRFRLINRNDRPYEDAYFGLYTDPDLGDAADDYLGSDPARSLAYAYNGDSFDGGAGGYGALPAAVGLTFLDSSDGQQMTDFVTIYKTIVRQLSEPENGEQANNYLRSTTILGNPVTYGGQGYGFSEEPTRFMFPSFPGEFWSMENVDGQGTSLGTADQRFVASNGPFTLQPGEARDIVVAYVWARSDDRIESVRRLQAATDQVQAAWDAGFDIVPPSRPPAVPAFTVPANEATGQPLDLVFAWESVPGIGYDFQLSSSPGFEVLLSERQTGTPRTGLDQLLRGNTAYYWRVRAFNDAGESPWSDPIRFTTGNITAPRTSGLLRIGEYTPAFVQVAAPDGVTPCGPNAPENPACEEVGGHSVYETIDATGNFYLARAPFWQVPTSEVIGNYAPNDFELRFTETGSVGVHSFTSGRGYRVPVEAWDIGPVGPFNENDPSDDVQLVVHLLAETGSEPPSEDIECEFGYTLGRLDFPGGSFLGTPQLFASYPATSYAEFAQAAQAELDAGGGCTVLSEQTRAEADTSRGFPLRHLTFYGRPDSTAAHPGAPLPGNVIRFYTEANAAPLLASPANASALPGSTLDLYWYSGNAVQVSIDPAFERVVFDTSVEPAEDAGLVRAAVPSLRAGRYYWRAGQRSTVGTRWSAPWSFTVATPVDTEVGANVPATLALQPSYPNPFAATTTLPYGLPEAGEVSANVYDLLGRRVATLATRERRPAGWHELRIDGARWPSGVYFVALEAGGQRAVQRVLVVR